MKIASGGAFTWILFILLLGTFGCSTNDLIPPRNLLPLPTLIKTRFPGQDNTYIETFSYDTERRLVRSQSYYDSELRSGPDNLDYTGYSYDQNGNLTGSQSKNLTYWSVVEYDGNGEVSKVYQYGPNGSTSVFEYSYNATNQLIKRAYYRYYQGNKILDYSDEYEYPNVDTKNYSVGKRYDFILRTSHYTWDDKKSPYSNLPGWWGQYFGQANILRVTTRLSVGGGDYMERYSYDYNKEGYPIAIKINGVIIVTIAYLNK